MKKQIIIEKVKVINHDKFAELIIYTLYSGFFSFLFVIFGLAPFKIKLSISEFSLIYLLIMFIFVFIYLYNKLGEETIEQIEKEVWIK